MNKANGNVVEPDAGPGFGPNTPDTMIAQYGADALRLFSLVSAPAEREMELTDTGMEGCGRFLARVWRLVEMHESVFQGLQAYSGRHADIQHLPSRELRAKVHRTIAKVQHDVGHGYRFNTAIASLMELVNELSLFQIELGASDCRAVFKESVECLIKVLHPFAPHLTEELWERLGSPGMLVHHRLPEPDPDALEREVFPLSAQVHGLIKETA